MDQKARTICAKSDVYPSSCGDNLLTLGAVRNQRHHCSPTRTESLHKVPGSVCPFRTKEKIHLSRVQRRSLASVLLGHFALHPVPFNEHRLAFKESQVFCLLVKKKGNKIGRSFGFLLIYDNTMWLWAQTNPFLIAFSLLPKHSLCFKNI